MSFSCLSIKNESLHLITIFVKGPYFLVVMGTVPVICVLVVHGYMCAEGCVFGEQ